MKVKHLIAVLVVMAVILVGYMVQPYRINLITSGSMNDIIPTNSAYIIDTRVQFSDLKVGDIITYTTEYVPAPVTHQIIQSGYDVYGQKVFVTKGTNNDAPDNWVVHESDIKGKYVGGFTFLVKWYMDTFVGDMTDSVGSEVAIRGMFPLLIFMGMIWLLIVIVKKIRGGISKMKQARQDIMMTTTYGRSNKSGVHFKAVLGKVLVSSLALSVALGSFSLPAFATDDVRSESEMTMIEKSMNDSFESLKDTVSRIEQMKAEGVVSNVTLASLAKAIDRLEGSVGISTHEAEYVFERVEKILEGLNKPNVELVKNSLKSARERLGIFTMIETPYARAEDTIVSSSIGFPDVNSGDWFYNSVMGLVGLGAINGYPDGTFAPNNTITYAEYLTILVKTTNAGDGNYSVGEGEPWYNGVLRAAYESDIIRNGDVKDFEAPINRADAAKFTEKAVQRVLGESEVNTEKLSSIIGDFNSSIKGTSAEYYILQQYGRGIIVGDDKGNFNPDSNLTRAEASTIILRTVRPENRSEVKTPEEVEDPYTITDNKFYNGRMKVDVATEFDLQALSSARFYRENGKLYVSIDLPELPDGFVWNPCVSAYDKDGNYVFCSTEDMDYGKSGHLVIEVVSAFSDKTTDDIASASLGIRVENSKRESMLGHTLSTDMPNKVLRESDTDSTDFEWLDFDTSSIFNW